MTSVRRSVGGDFADGLEMNMATNAEAMAAGSHPGYELTALEGLSLSLDILNEKRIKVVINGGSLRPKALAEKVYSLVCIKWYTLIMTLLTSDRY